MPCRTITDQQNDILSIFHAEFSQKYSHAVCITIGHDKKKRLAGNRFNRSVGITILPNVMAWYTRTNPFFTPAVLRLVYTTKTSFILKHEPDCLGAVETFQLFDSGFNFFEVSMTSSLALFGCLLLGMTFRQLCRCNTR